MRVKRCRDCGAPITLARVSGSGKWAAFEPIPVPADVKDANRHRYLSGVTAATVGELVESIQQAAEVPLERARDIARDDYPWHAFHDCPNRKDTT